MDQKSSERKKGNLSIYISKAKKQTRNIKEKKTRQTVNKNNNKLSVMTLIHNFKDKY